MAAIMATSRMTAAISTGYRYLVYSSLPSSLVLEYWTGLPAHPHHAAARPWALHATEAAHQHRRHFQGDHAPISAGQREVLPETLAHAVDVDVEHHHHEQEQHHHRAQVHQHQRDGQELGLEQHPDGGRLEKGQHQVQHGMHRVARRDHPEGGKQQHDREQVKKPVLTSIHGSFRKSWGLPRQRYLASAALAAAISPS
jgi:hypothetical protein